MRASSTASRSFNAPRRVALLLGLIRQCHRLVDQPLIGVERLSERFDGIKLMQVGTALSILPKDPADVPLAHAGHLSYMALAKAPEPRRHDCPVPLRPLIGGHWASVLRPWHATYIAPHYPKVAGAAWPAVPSAGGF